jgi:hypothetical protein
VADQQIQLAENVRHRFSSPVAIQWIDEEGARSSISGTSEDASVHGLGVVIPVHIPVETEVTVHLRGVAICGSAKVRYSQSCAAGFKVGLQFKQALFLQNIPGLDQILMGSFYSGYKGAVPHRNSFVQRIRMLLCRALMTDNR